MGAISALDCAFSHTGMCRFAAVLLCLSLISPPVVAKSPKAKTKLSASKATRDAAPLIPQSAWNALTNTWVEVSVRDGRTVRGRLVGVDQSIVTIVEQSGQVVALELPNALREYPPEKWRETELCSIALIHQVGTSCRSVAKPLSVVTSPASRRPMIVIMA